MRTILLCLFAALCCAAEPPPPPIPPAVQKLVDDSTTVVAKARQTYSQAAKKEQDKLAAALTKEQERETKKGNLDGALAIKTLIEEVQNGLLTKKADEVADLLGDSEKAPAAGTTPANLATDCAIAPAAARATGAPKAIEAMMARASVLAIPKGDKTHYTFSVMAAGTVAIMTGGSERNHADLWPELLKAGFKRAEDGEGGAWFILEARPGAKFTVYDPPLAGAQVQIFAGKIKRL
jgi:hypothetical protein